MTNLSSIAGFSAGGGGGGAVADGELHGSTPVAIAQIDRTGHDDKKPYSYTSGLFPAASPNGAVKSRNVFSTWAQWANHPSSMTGFHVSAFSVDRSTGAITILQNGPQVVWEHSSGAAISTTYCVFDPVHGCFFSAGNNGYNNQGGHVFGYTAGQIATDGSLNGGTSVQSGSDHYTNGTFCGGLHQGTGTNYFMTSGYGPSYNGYRLHTAEATGITVGSWNTNGSWTSSGQPWHHHWQPDQTPNAGEINCGNGASFSSPNYGWVLARGNSVSGHNSQNGYSFADVYQGAGGVPFIVQDQYAYGTIGNGSNSFTNLADGDRDFGSHCMGSINYGIPVVGIGNNKFLWFKPGDDAFNSRNDICELIGIEANQNPKRLAHLTMGEQTDKSILDGTAHVQSYYTVFENDNDPYPRWLVKAHPSETRYVTIEVFDMTTDFSAFTI